MRNASPTELRIGDWIVINGAAYLITNLYSPGHDGTVKTVVLRGHAPVRIDTWHAIVRPYGPTNGTPRRAW